MGQKRSQTMDLSTEEMKLLLVFASSTKELPGSQAGVLNRYWKDKRCNAYPVLDKIF